MPPDIEKSPAMFRVISYRNDRLGARLCSIASGIKIAGALNCSFKFVWPSRHDEFGDDINDGRKIFSESFLANYLIDEKEMERSIGVPVEHSFAMIIKEMVTIYKCDGIYTIVISMPFGEVGHKMINTALQKSGLSPLSRLPRITDSFRKIEFSDQILELVANLGSDISPGAVGLHVRRGDILTEFNDNFSKMRYAPLEFFVDYVKKHVPEENMVIIFSEDLDAARDLETMIRGNYDVRVITEISKSSLIQACVELILMSRLSVVVGTWSAFRQTACFLGSTESVDFNRFVSDEDQIPLLEESVVRLARVEKDRAELKTAAIKLGLAYFREYVKAMKRGNFEKARELIGKAVAHHPKDEHARERVVVEGYLAEDRHARLDTTFVSKLRSIGRKKSRPEPHNLTEQGIFRLASFPGTGAQLFIRSMTKLPGIAYLPSSEPGGISDPGWLTKPLPEGGPEMFPRAIVHQLSKGNLVLAQADFQDPFPGMKGLAFVRNPFSTFAGLFIGLEGSPVQKHPKRLLTQVGRMIDENLESALNPWNDFTSFAILYNRRMAALLDSGMTVLRFEDFVANPGTILRRLALRLGLKWNPKATGPYHAYSQRSSQQHHADPHPRNFYDGSNHIAIPGAQLSRLSALCYPVTKRLGYAVEKGELILEPRPRIFP